jgi:hypothetical protein
VRYVLVGFSRGHEESGSSRAGNNGSGGGGGGSGGGGGGGGNSGGNDSLENDPTQNFPVVFGLPYTIPINPPEHSISSSSSSSREPAEPVRLVLSGGSTGGDGGDGILACKLEKEKEVSVDEENDEAISLKHAINKQNAMPHQQAQIRENEYRVELRVNWQVDARVCNGSNARSFQMHTMDKPKAYISPISAEEKGQLKQQQQQSHRPSPEVRIVWLVCHCPDTTAGADDATGVNGVFTFQGRTLSNSNALGLPSFVSAFSRGSNIRKEDSNTQTAELSLPLHLGFVDSSGSMLFAFPPGHKYAAFRLSV